MKIYMRVLMAGTRLNAMWLFMLGYTRALAGNRMAVWDFLLAAGLVWLEVNYLVKHIEDDNKHK